MNIWKISLQNIKSKPLYTFLSVCVLALSITLLLGIQQLKYSFKNQIETNLGKIDLVIGAKGSPLQLVLASVLHLDNPTGNISYTEAQNIIKNPRVKSAVPISYGDNYKGYRIVGTTETFLSIYNAELETGSNVEQSMEVVLGATVAKTLNLKVGDTFLSSHGLIENTVDIHNDELTIVGILKPTHKVIDRLIVTNLESIWDVHHHEVEDTSHADYHHHDHDEVAKEIEADKEITSLLVTFKSPRSLLTFPRKINESTNMLAALPRYELHKLYEYTSVGFQTITWIAYLILVMSGLTIFISLYKMVKERAFDLAILRTYGASNFQLIKMVLYEGLIIAFLAFVIAYLFVKIGLAIVLNFMVASNQQNLLVNLPYQELVYLGILVFFKVVLSVSLAIYPIIKMNISTILSHEK